MKSRDHLALSLFTSISAGLLGGWIFSAVSEPDSVRAQSIAQSLAVRELRLVDEGGTVRAKIETDSEGAVRFQLNNNLAQPVLSMAVSGDGMPVFGIYDNSQVLRFGLVTTGDAAKLVFADKNGRDRVVIGVDDDDDSILTLKDKSGRSGILMYAEKVGATQISVVDLEGHERVRTVSTADGTAGLSIMDTNEKVRLVMATTSDDRVVVTTLDKEGKVVE